METTHNPRSHVIVTKTKDNIISSHQKTFNRLIKKVRDLQSQQECTIRELDEALQFYHTTMHPDELVLLQHLAERVAIAYEFYKTAKSFSKKELGVFKELLAEQINQICTIYDAHEIPSSVKEVFKGVYDIGFEECYVQESTEVKKELEEEFKTFFGEDVDFSDVDMSGSQEDIMRNIFMKVGQAANDLKEKFIQRPKTKKQLEKEAKKQAVEELQNKSLQTIYKQLARTLHPDLEQDVEKRALKEELMKKVTAAYEKNDLYALIKVEMEWMNCSVDKMQSYDDDDIKIYNAILKDQVKELEIAQSMLIMHARYIAIQRFYPFGFSGITALQRKYDELKESIQDVQATVIRLKTSEAKTFLKEIMQARIARAKNACTCGTC